MDAIVEVEVMDLDVGEVTTGEDRDSLAPFCPRCTSDVSGVVVAVGGAAAAGAAVEAQGGNLIEDGNGDGEDVFNDPGEGEQSRGVAP